jgi:hypothetical protein
LWLPVTITPRRHEPDVDHLATAGNQPADQRLGQRLARRAAVPADRDLLLAALEHLAADRAPELVGEADVQGLPVDAPDVVGAEHRFAELAHGGCGGDGRLGDRRRLRGRGLWRGWRRGAAGRAVARHCPPVFRRLQCLQQVGRFRELGRLTAAVLPEARQVAHGVDDDRAVRGIGTLHPGGPHPADPEHQQHRRTADCGGEDPAARADGHRPVGNLQDGAGDLDRAGGRTLRRGGTFVHRDRHAATGDLLDHLDAGCLPAQRVDALLDH